MIDDDFKDAFSSLNLLEKRNQISNELLYIANLIKLKEEQLDIKSALNVKKYNIDIQSNFTENEMLDFLFEDIYCIKRELLTLLSFDKN